MLLLFFLLFFFCFISRNKLIAVKKTEGEILKFFLKNCLFTRINSYLIFRVLVIISRNFGFTKVTKYKNLHFSRRNLPENRGFNSIFRICSY